MLDHQRPDKPSQHDTLLHYEQTWPTSIGQAFVGVRAVMHGQDLLYDLADLQWIELHYYSITGRKGDVDKLRLMMHVFTGCSYPDPRIWNNRITALAGTTRSTAALAIGAGVAVSEATIYGHRANKKCIDTLLRAQQALDNGLSLEQFVTTELAAGRKFYGYGRPIRDQDERIESAQYLIQQFNVQNDPFISLCYQIEAILQHKKNLNINITGLSAAFAASLGLTPIEYHLFLCPLFIMGMSPCYKDAISKPEGSFMPLRCDAIHYQGPNEQNWTSA